MLRSITIQKRLLIAFGAIALLLAVTGLFSLQSLSKVRTQADLVETNILPAISYLGQVEALAHRSRASTLRLLLSLDITQEGKTFEAIKQLNLEKENASEKYVATIYLAEERALYQQFAQVDDEYRELQRQALDFLQKEELGAAQDLLDQMNPLADKMVSLLAQLSAPSLFLLLFLVCFLLPV